MKMHLVAAAACAAFVGHAHALDKAGTAAAQVQVYLSGSSALKAAIAGSISQNAQAGTFTNFKNVTAAPFNDSSAGSSYNIYSATMIAGNDFGLPTGTTVALHTRQRGGSYFGVVPVAKNSPIAFLDLTSCSDGANTCTATLTRAPDGGISDEEPAIFANPNNVPTGNSVVTVSNADYLDAPKAVAGQVFGVAMSNALFTALGGVIGANNVPSTFATVPKSGVATMLISGYDPSTLGWNPVGLNSHNGVNIIRRANGSGTQAAFNLFFFDLASSTLSVQPSTAADSGATDVTTLTDDLFIFEGSSSDNVIGKLNAANAIGAYALGVLSLDKDPSAVGNGQGWNFAAVDGTTASRDNYKLGKYGFGYETTVQINKLAPIAAATDAGSFLRKFRDQFGLTKNIAQLSAEGKLGVVALPGNVPGAAGTWAGNDLTFGSRVTRGGESRNPLVFAK